MNTKYEKAIFRVVFIYFLLQALPLDWKFYSYLFSVNWLHLQYQDIFNLAHYTTRFSMGEVGYGDWGILLLIAVVGGIIWKTNIDDKLYYWLRVILRYRLALALLAYGFIKFFPLLAPYPSISLLNTPYGHFNRWKLFSLSLGIVPSYELFLGLVEIVIALLLINRRTASIGAFIFLIFCGNIFMSNLAYEGGDQVYSLLLITFALVIFSADLVRIVRLLILRLPTAPPSFQPLYRNKGIRYVLKSLFILLFVVIYGFKAGSGSSQYPVKKGLPAVAGLYNVSVFKVNNDTIAYSVTDSLRWQNVVFEEWNTLSIRSNRPVSIDSNNQHVLFSEGSKRLYELEGANWRHYYSYTVDSVNRLLLLKNRNPHDSSETWVLRYNRPDWKHIVLSGVTPQKDSIYVVLERLSKKYLLEEAAKGRDKKLRL
ncbi:hypothetical protein SAMN05428988_5332 [Chitinophaga sp. YR573]|uniref:hypothetical protein n=1 Tax=Chitinophaga sp. YR573 TaxID=1881040 RepID=UPI0008B30E8B|nr:hypothetical protein [Chitinophaga sp. YR573]SEW40603.1 hypothetical protein SAMN05428988_5332 [Chitinophaga sp. YR573]